MVSLPVLPADCCLNKLFPCCHKEVSNASTEEGNKKAKIELCPCKKRITKLVKTLKENEKDQELTGKIGKGITVLYDYAFCTWKDAATFTYMPYRFRNHSRVRDPTTPKSSAPQSRRGMSREPPAGLNKSQTTSSSGARNSGKIATRKRKHDLSENLGLELTITMNNEDYRSLKLEMAQMLKMDIVLSNKAVQPFVKTHNSNERVLIGFGSHQNRTKPKTTEASGMFVSPCPLECSIDDRQWICINCGEFFKADGLQVICSCGRTHVANMKFDCFDPEHPKEIFPM
uniref:Uncharacterized protein n=1 Tax=Panagrolaimus sp. JU765 TaxID=591449 RepID=A0AC34PYL5_9BILA